MAKILILGGGFGGLVTAERLSTALMGDHEITLISPRSRFTFYPALVRLAFGDLDPEDVTFDLAEKLFQLGVRFIEGEMLDIDPSSKAVRITGDDVTGEVNYDYLVIATGRRLATESTPGFFEYSHHLLGTGAALKFGEAVNDFRKGRIVLGLCPDGRLPVPVCEAAFALARRFFFQIEAGDIRISVIFPDTLANAFGGASLHTELESAFAKNHINVHYNIPISEITSSHLKSSKGHEIEHDLVMLVPPFRGNAAFRSAGITDENDFIRVNGLMQVAGLANTYAVGDIVAFSGPKFAHMAVRQAEIAAENLLLELNDKNPVREYYHEISTVIDAAGPDSIYLHYGIWDDNQYSVKKGRIWGWAKEAHDAWWQARNL